MNRKQQIKLVSVVTLILVLAAATALTLYALKQNINLFYTPTQLLSLQNPEAQTLRLGGYVKKHSVHYTADGKAVVFILMDTKNQVEVSFNGVLPTLFREGQGVVVTGKLLNLQQLAATEVLAKHDEKYVPKYLAEDLEKS
jgi:cytochrome c-type biogenesis protein CcmE